MKNILFIAAHRPGRSPSQRFRFEQYLPFLEPAGFNYDFSYLISPEDDLYFNKPGHYLQKISTVMKAAFVRLKDVLRAGNYDIIFIQREAFMLGSTFFEALFKKRKAKIIFDFDDAIWLHDISPANKSVAFLKKPSKTAEIIAMSDLVFAGNGYLADYARQYNKNVLIIPTTIDTDEYKPGLKKAGDKMVIGWSGSFSTVKHFSEAVPALEAVRKQFGDRVSFQVIGDTSYHNESLEIQGIPWKLATEVDDLQKFDIGIMPLPDDQWSRGKCGLKGLQYMALEIPTIMSPVGVNTEIITDGENGFLASSPEEWINKLSHLINNETSRKAMGLAGRKTVEERYSVKALKDTYITTFKNISAR